MNYFIKTPWWLKRIYPSYTWSLDTKTKMIWLTFDDGPHPVATPFVLDELKKNEAKATFFCIGKNVVGFPDIYQRILDEGHGIGNHTQHHLNGWKTKDKLYLEDIAEAAKHIDSSLFRPPYGRITSFQAKHISKAVRKEKARIVMWDVLSADFDESLSPQRCIENVILNTVKGSIVVFHDSEKAFPRLRHSLPEILAFFKQEGYQFGKLEN
jgi:peptidoglycan-N-acetylglucosamine deacetylase